MNEKELELLCVDINRDKSPAWNRCVAIAYRRCKRGIPSNYGDFTIAEKLYVWTGFAFGRDL